MLMGVFTYSPRKTIATAQNLYHRFHLFFPRKDFGYHVRHTTSSDYCVAYILTIVAGCCSRSAVRIHKDARHAQETTRNRHGFVCSPLSGTRCKVEVHGGRN